MKRTISTLLTVVVTLLIITQPVAAQADLSDLTTYTENDASGTVNVVSPSEIRIDDHSDTDFSAIYESEVSTSDKSITISYDLRINSSSQDGAIWASGLHEDTSPFGDNEWQNVYGIRAPGSSITQLDLINPFSGESNTVANIGSDTTRHVTLEYDQTNAQMTATIYETSSGDTVLGNATTPYPVANNLTITPFISQGSGSGSSMSGVISNYSVSVTTHSNQGENLNDYTVNDGSNVLNVSANWITLNGVSDNNERFVKRDGLTNNQYVVDFRYIVTGPTDDGSFMYGGFGYDSVSTGFEGTTGYELRDTQGIRSQSHYYGRGTTQGGINTNELYYGRLTIDRINGTVNTTLYSDISRSTIAVTAEAYFPAGESYPSYYPIISQQTGNGNHFYGNIGYIQMTQYQIDNTGNDMTTWTQTGQDNAINSTSNWVSLHNLNDQVTGGIVFNESGPGINNATMDFELYSKSNNGNYWAMGWAEGDPQYSFDGNFLGFMYRDNDEIQIYTPSGRSTIGGLSSETLYYGRIDKTGSILNVTFYTDRERTNIAVTGETSFSNSFDFDRTYAIASQSTGSGATFTGHLNVGVDASYIQPFTGNITLEVSNWMAHGSTQNAVVRVVETGNTVTSETSISSANTTVITVSGDQLTATNDQSIAQRVIITANYRGQVDTENVTVANRTIEHIEIMPPEQYPSTFAGVDEEQAAYGIGGEIQWILLAILVGSMGSWIARNEFMGLGIISILIILFWANGTVSLGIVMVTVFYSLFVGNLLRDTPSRSDTNVGGGLT